MRRNINQLINYKNVKNVQLVMCLRYNILSKPVLCSSENEIVTSGFSDLLIITYNFITLLIVKNQHKVLRVRWP